MDMSYFPNDTFFPSNFSLYLNCTGLDPNSSLYLETCTPQPPPPHQPWWIQMIVQILYGIVCCVGLCGNTLVIYVVVRFSKMQTVTNLYIVNLAIADELFLVGIPFLMTTVGLGYWPFGSWVCKAYFTSTSINQITSSMFLLIMSADRYLAVCHPISAPRYRTPLVAKFVALTAWTLSALIMVPIFLYANTLELNNKTNCNIFWPTNSHWTGESIFIVYSFIISFAVPLILISIFYVLVILKLRTVGPKRHPPVPQNQNQTLSTSAPPSIALSSTTGRKESSADPVPLTPQQATRARDRKRSHRKVTKLVLTVITVYFICWAPYWATQMALIFMPNDSNHSDTVLTLFLLAGCFSYSNSTMNPILYAFLSDNFKKSFLKACTCAKGQDINAQLHMDNSIFPRGRKSEKGKNKGVASSGASGINQPHNANSNTGSGSGAALLATTNANTNTGSRSYLQVPSQQGHQKVPDIIDFEDESGESEDDEGAAILGTGSASSCGFNGAGIGIGGCGRGGMLNVNTIITNSSTPSTSTTTGGGISFENHPTTFIQDGMHVTSL